MGWGPDDEKHLIGPRFANKIQPGDVILIARRFKGVPETVGFGKVTGGFNTSLAGFKPPETFGSLRRLAPFIPMSRPPASLPLLAAVDQIPALHRLAPEKNAQHKALCRWLDKKLAQPSKGSRPAPKNGPKTTTFKFGRPQAGGGPLEYQIKTKKSVKQAQMREAALVERYRLWLESQDRKLRLFRIGLLKCDAYEHGRKNLIEAKCSPKREYVRMAVGQLLDYEFQAHAKIGKCHKAILLPGKPEGSLMRWLKSLEIGVVWEDGTDFLDSANGQFS